MDRLIRGKVPGAGAPTVVDPCAALLRQLSEAKQCAVDILQGSIDGHRKLPEASAKVLQASTQFLEMVREELALLEDTTNEGGGLQRTTTPRLPPAIAGKAVALLVDACHVAMRALLDHAEAAQRAMQQDAQVALDTAAAGPSTSCAPAPPPPFPPATSLPPQHLWRCGVNVAAALQDASRLLAAAPFYSAYRSADPSAEALLSIGELAAGVMDAATAATLTAATAAAGSPAAVTQQPQRTGGGGDGVAAGGGAEEAGRCSGGQGRQGRGSLGLLKGVGLEMPGGDGGCEGALCPSDAACLLGAHGYSLLLVACEQQPEGLLDALLHQPGASQRLHHLAMSALHLAAARIRETCHCGVGAGGSGGPDDTTTTTTTAQQHPYNNNTNDPHRSSTLTATSENGNLSCPSSSSTAALPAPSFQLRQLQLVALRVSELLADDGGFKRRAREVLIPALAEVLSAEHNRLASWWCCGVDSLHAGLSTPELITAPRLDQEPLPPTIAGTSALISTTSTAPATSPDLSTSPNRTLPSPPPPPLACSPGGPASSSLLQPPACPSAQDDKLQAAAVGMLLKSPVSRNHILPLLLSCARLPGGLGARGLAAFGPGFRQERFLYANDDGTEGTDREELYVGGRGRGYKRRRVLNPEAHGVNSEQVGAVTAAMSAALEVAVLLCRIFANAIVSAVSEEEDEEPVSGGAAAGGAETDPVIGPPPATAATITAAMDAGSGRGGGGGGGSCIALSSLSPTAAARGGGGRGHQVPSASWHHGPQGGLAASLGLSPQQLDTLPLASTLLRLLTVSYRSTATTTNSAKSAARPASLGGKAADVAATEAGGDVVAPNGAPAAVLDQLRHMSRTLAMVLSLLQPVCPDGGGEVRQALLQMGFPVLRWPRMNVRLPVLLVAEDCELLLGLLQDLCTAASGLEPPPRRPFNKPLLQASEAGHDGGGQQEEEEEEAAEAEAREAERRQQQQRDKDRQRQRVRGGRKQQQQEAEESEEEEMEDEGSGGGAGRGGGGAIVRQSAAAGGLRSVRYGAQMMVQGGLEEGVMGGALPQVPHPHLGGMGPPGGGAGAQRGLSPPPGRGSTRPQRAAAATAAAAAGLYDNGALTAAGADQDVGGGGGAASRVRLVLRRGSNGGVSGALGGPQGGGSPPPGVGLGMGVGVGVGTARLGTRKRTGVGAVVAVGVAPGEQEEEAAGRGLALPLGLQVPRQKRSNRPVRPRTPTPPSPLRATADHGVVAGPTATQRPMRVGRSAAAGGEGGGSGATSPDSDSWIGPPNVGVGAAGAAVLTATAMRGGMMGAGGKAQSYGAVYSATGAPPQAEAPHMSYGSGGGAVLMPPALPPLSHPSRHPAHHEQHLAALHHHRPHPQAHRAVEVGGGPAAVAGWGAGAAGVCGPQRGRQEAPSGPPPHVYGAYPYDSPQPYS